MELTFAEYLTEGRTSSISEQDAIATIKNLGCEQYLRSVGDQPLYRGFNSKDAIGRSGPYKRGNSQNTERISGFAKDNYYNLVFSSLPSWEQFPPRNYSFICSTKAESADNYGNVHHVIVPDDTKIGVVPKIDIQMARFELSGAEYHVTPLSLNGFISSAEGYHRLNIDNSLFTKAMRHLPSLINLLQQLIEHKQVLKEDMMNYYVFESMVEYLEQNGVEKGLNQLFDPKANGFKIVQGSNAGSIPKDREVWFSGSAIFIKGQDNYQRVVRAVLGD